MEAIISISRRDISAGVAYIKPEATQLGIPGIKDLVLEEMVGGRIQGLIGIANSRLMPTLVFMSSLGVGIFKTPLRDVNRGPSYLIGGSYPTMAAMVAGRVYPITCSLCMTRSMSGKARSITEALSPSRTSRRRYTGLTRIMTEYP